MTDFIVNNYVLIIAIAAFLIFALIGFAIDTTKNKKNKEDEILTEHEDVVIEEVENNLESPSGDVTDLEIKEPEAPEEEPQVTMDEPAEEEFKIPEVEDNNK
jgi:hypothetical protein